MRFWNILYEGQIQYKSSHFCPQKCHVSSSDWCKVKWTFPNLTWQLHVGTYLLNLTLTYGILHTCHAIADISHLNYLTYNMNCL